MNAARNGIVEIGFAFTQKIPDTHIVGSSRTDNRGDDLGIKRDSNFPFRLGAGSKNFGFGEDFSRDALPINANTVARGLKGLNAATIVRANVGDEFKDSVDGRL